eukprot:Skav227785  [mRNA]  locus=scaffold1237:174468:178224:+ [translate_table: standard]
MVLSREEARCRLKVAGVERCYSDPLLRHHETFATFVKRLWKLGLMDLSLEAGDEQVEMFCVKKKQNRLRLIVDSDLQNAFYIMSMPMPLRRYFCLWRVRVAELGMEELGGQRLRKDAWLIPRIAVLPMGWTWALWWCQRLYERIAERAGLTPGERL